MAGRLRTDLLRETGKQVACCRRIGSTPVLRSAQTTDLRPRKQRQPSEPQAGRIGNLILGSSGGQGDTEEHLGAGMLGMSLWALESLEQV